MDWSDEKKVRIPEICVEAFDSSLILFSKKVEDAP